MFTVIAGIAADVILKEDLQEASSVTSYVKTVSTYLQVQLRLVGLVVAEYLLYFKSLV